MEKKLLGVSLTRTNIETAYDRYMANCSCEDFKNGYNNNNGIILAVEINNIRMTKTKKGENPGQEMAFIEVSDETGFLNSVVLFPDSWETNKEHCHISNTVLLIGSRSKDKNSLVISEIYQI
jgi:DNA polymerase III alpha subunit